MTINRETIPRERERDTIHIQSTVTHKNILPFLKYINFKEKMLPEGIIIKYFSYILINITRGTQK